MSVEQIARDFISSMTDKSRIQSMLTPDAMASGGVLPAAVPASEAIGYIDGLKAAFPDLKFDVKQVSVNGDKATVKANWGGTNTGELKLPIPGMPGIPATGKKVSVPDTYIVTVRGDKVSHMEVQSPAEGGIPGALNQMGVKMPGMGMPGM